MTEQRISEQLAVMLVALLAWVTLEEPSFGGLLAAYAIGWLVVNIARVGEARWLRAPLTRTQRALLISAVAIPSVANGVRQWDRFVEAERLGSIAHSTAARIRLEREPSIAPPLVSADRPQTFYVRAPGAERVEVELGGPSIAARALGHGLFRVAYDPRRDGRPRVGDGPFDAVLRIDGEPHPRTMHAVHPLAHPRWLRASGERAVTVSEETDELLVIEANGSMRRVRVDDGPSDACYVGDRVAVVHRYTRVLVWVDPARGRITERATLPAPFALRIACADDRLAITFGGAEPTVQWFDMHGRSIARTRLDTEAEWIAFGPDESLVIARRATASLHRLRRTGSRLTVDASLRFGRPVVTMGVHGTRAMVAVTDVQTDGRAHFGNHFVQDELLTIDLDRFAIVERRRTALRTPRQGSPGSTDRGVSPVGIALSDQNTLVAFAGTDEVWSIDPGAAEPTVIDLAEQPLPAPISAVALGDRIAVSSAASGAIGLFARDGRRLALARFAPSDYELVEAGHDRALQRRIGERVFYESTRAGISCQSCHLHGESDGARHNIGSHALASTLDVRGTMGTPPYLRDGSYPRLGSLDDVAQELYRGYLRRQGGRVISLERFLEALPRPTPPRQLGERDEARERRGLDAFVKARCPLCHAFPAFTNLGQHPVGAIFEASTGEPSATLDTPSLLGVGQSAPYLTDGRAANLAAIFREHDPRHRHGDTRRLRRAEFDDLLYFVEGL